METHGPALPSRRTLIVSLIVAASGVASGGCRAMTLGVPGRYVHTVTEMCHKGDLEACRDLLAKYLETVK